MGVTAKDVAPYIGNETTLAILNSLGCTGLPLSKIVAKVQEPAEDVAVWLHDMKVKGVVRHEISEPHSKTEAVFSLTPEARKAFLELCEPIARGDQ
jgi:hypothetical protein